MDRYQTRRRIGRAAAPELANIDTLDLFGSPLGDVGIAALAKLKLPALRQLNLNYVGLTAAGIAALVTAPWFGDLEILSVANNDLPVGAAIPIAKAGRSLVELEINGEADDALVKAIAGSKAMRSLRRLDIGYLTAVGAAAIAKSPNCKQLDELAYLEQPKTEKLSAVARIKSHDWQRFGAEDFTGLSGAIR